MRHGQGAASAVPRNNTSQMDSRLPQNPKNLRKTATRLIIRTIIRIVPSVEGFGFLGRRPPPARKAEGRGGKCVRDKNFRQIRSVWCRGIWPGRVKAGSGFGHGPAKEGRSVGPDVGVCDAQAAFLDGSTFRACKFSESADLPSGRAGVRCNRRSPGISTHRASGGDLHNGPSRCQDRFFVQ